MDELGADPQYGCGRALWENNGETGKYGTTMALMLLPHWTDGCIPSMEGLFFEASGTTPYHFISAAAMSQQSSNPVRQLRYDNNDAAKGVPYLQSLGVKYVMVFTEAARAQADAQPELTKVRSVGPWNIYTVAGSDIVEPLAMQPVVVNRRDGDQRERNLELGMSWFQHRDEWVAMPADDGPAAWQRIDVLPDVNRRQDDRVDIVQPAQPITAVPLEPVTATRRAGSALHGRPGGRARPGEDQLLPQLGGLRGRGPVPNRAEHDGGGAHVHRCPPPVRSLERRSVRLPADGARHRAAGGVATHRRRAAPHGQSPRLRGRSRGRSRGR
jgi:hypothetical protein